MSVIKKINIVPVMIGFRSIFLSLLLLGSGQAMAAKPDATIYNEDNNTIQVSAQHPQFTIQLKSNPTTGYMWYLREYSTKMLTPLKHDFIAPQKKLIGASGYEQWTFKVNPEAFIVPQMLTIRMVYTRPWKSTDQGTQVIFRVMTGK